MIRYLIAKSELATLYRFLSPKLLKFLPPQDLLKTAKSLTTNYNKKDLWTQQNKLHYSEIKPLKIEVNGTNTFNYDKSILSPLEKKYYGEFVLGIFFFQILNTDSWILDFRHEKFSLHNKELHWTPLPFFSAIKPHFLLQIRNLYSGFYESDSEKYNTALENLYLTPAREVLYTHFGSHNQDSIIFELKTFQKNFAEIFERCSKNKGTLDSDFFLLGLSLLTLYQNLENLGVPLNVRKSFLAAKNKDLSSLFL